MRKFKFGNDSIIFDNDFEFYNKYWQIIQEITSESVYLFEERLEKIDSINVLIDTVDSIAQMQIDSAIGKSINMLMENGIIDYDIARFKNIAGDSVIFSSQKTTRLLKQNYQELKRKELEYQRQKEISRANRSRWEGGGFGVGGAIKGAITAGAMNAVTNGVRGVGDSIVDMSDASKYKEARRSLLNDRNLKGLKEDFQSCILNGVRITFAQILEEKTGKDARYILWEGETQAIAIYNNIDRMTNNQQKIHALKEIIELNPYKWQYLQYALDNCESMGIPLKDIQNIAEYVEKPSFLKYQLRIYREKWNTVIKEKSHDESYPILKNLAIEYGFIDNQFNLIKQEYNIGTEEPEKAVLYLAWIKVETNYGTSSDILKVDSYFALLEIEKHILGILKEHKIVIDDHKGYRIKSEFEHISPTTYSCEIIKLVKELPIKIEELYLAARTVRGIVFNSIDEAEIFKAEIDKYEKIYLEGKSYADYESSCLEEIITTLKAQEFQSAYLLGKISELQNRLQELRVHETSENLKWRKKVIDCFSGLEDENLYLYRKDSEFLDEAFKAKNADIMQQNGDKYPIMIYDVHSTTEKIEGFVLSESAIYDYTGFWGGRRIDFNDIQSIAYNEEKKLIFLMTSAGKNYKIKIGPTSEAKEIAVVLSLAILNKEAEYYEVQSIVKQAQGLLNNGIQFFTTWISKEHMSENPEKSEIKRCPKCGFSAKPQDNFCKQCGAKFESSNDTEISCPICGNPVNESMKFCPKCGKKLKED